MKTASCLLACSLLLSVAHGQGTINLPPVPVTSGVTGVLADSSIVAGLYYGPQGTAESALLMLSGPSPLVGGCPQFGTGVVLPLPAGASAELQVRAWSAPFASYDIAVASGSAAVLAGKSLLLSVILGGSPNPPPVPDPLSFPGFTIYPVPEPSPLLLVAGGVGLLLLTFTLRHARR